MDRSNVYRASLPMTHQSGDRAVPPASVARARQSPTLSGYCKLDKGRSVNLRAREASVLRITRGRVWLTFNPAQKAPSARLGDHFLSRGESISLAAGEAVVMESYGPADAPSAYFSWEALAASSAGENLAFSGRAGLLLPLQDLRLALGLTAAALGRLARGLAVGVVAGVMAVAVNFATIFVAKRDRDDSTRQALKPQSADNCVDCSGH